MDADAADRAARWAGVQPWRRAFHACNSLVLAFLPRLLGAGRWTVVGVMGALFALLLAFDLARLRTSRINELFFRMFPSLVSSRERTGIASSTWYALGGLLVYALFPVAIVVPALLVLGFADPAASVAGRLWGKRRLGKGTVLGSAVFYAVAFAIMATAVGPARAALAALIVTCIEVYPAAFDDNLTVPLAAAAALAVVA